jgi:protein-disulfide isomerase
MYHSINQRGPNLPSMIATMLLLTLTALPVLAEAAIYEGIAVGFTENGDPYLGAPDAPVILEEWSDYLCPFCGRHFQQTHPHLVEQYVRAGELQIIFRDLPLISLHPSAARGHVAARCAGALGGAEGYWRMHDDLFNRQAEWQRLPEPDPFLLELAVARGLSRTEFSTCQTSPEPAAAVAASVAQGREAGFSGTPTFQFRMQGQEQRYGLSGALPLASFARVTEALLTGEAPPEPDTPPPPQLPLWATPEGFAPDPARPGFNLAGDPYKGDPGPLTVIAFTDFQCPACKRHAQEVQSLIDETLIDSGKVLWISKHLPLKSHPQAAIAAAAAECAGDQGLYWQMYDALFVDVDRWANDNAEAEFTRMSASIGANTDMFAGCLRGRQSMERVLSDLYDAQGLIESVPAFVVVQNGRGTLMRPLEAEQFVAYLKRRLDPPGDTGL